MDLFTQFCPYVWIAMCYFINWMCIQYYRNIKDYILELTMFFSKDHICKLTSKAGCIFKVALGERYLVGLSKAC